MLRSSLSLIKAFACPEEWSTQTPSPSFPFFTGHDTSGAVPSSVCRYSSVAEQIRMDTETSGIEWNGNLYSPSTCRSPRAHCCLFHSSPSLILDPFSSPFSGPEVALGSHPDVILRMTFHYVTFPSEREPVLSHMSCFNTLAEREAITFLRQHDISHMPGRLYESRAGLLSVPSPLGFISIFLLALASPVRDTMSRRAGHKHRAKLFP